MGISMAGGLGAFDYNRFDALENAYRSLYEEKEEKDEDESDEDDEKEMNPSQKKKHEDDESEDEEESEEKDDDDKDEDSDEKEEKSDKKFPSFLKKSKEEKVEEGVIIDYLMSEGFVNNEVSAEVMCKFMSEEWREEILEGYKELPVGKMMKQTARMNAGDYRQSAKEKIDKIADVADKHDAQTSKEKSDENRDNAYFKRIGKAKG
jgi:hypothetical protein